MRPVTRGDQDDYKPRVDVSSTQNALETSLAGVPLHFQKKAAATAKKLWGTPHPTAQQVLKDLLLVAKAPKNPAANTNGPSRIDKIKSFKKTIKNNLSGVYGTSSGDLEQNLGRYCSFCEVFMPTGPAVEHILPKSAYPLFYLAWDNFLLTCAACNSAKHAKPPRDDALFTSKPKSEIGYYKQITEKYLWPDTKSKNVYRLTLPRLEYQVNSSGRWFPVTYPVSPGTKITNQEQKKRTLRADIHTDSRPVMRGGVRPPATPKWERDVPVRVVVHTVGEESSRMVSLVNLNRTGFNEKKPGGEFDIRTWLRTEYWFEALRAFRSLQEAADLAEFDRHWPTMMFCAKTSGMYSVWVRVLDLLGPNKTWLVPGGTDSVMDRFLTEIVGPGYFVGTDTANTP